jgi:hypothetical protein
MASPPESKQFANFHLIISREWIRGVQESACQRSAIYLINQIQKPTRPHAKRASKRNDVQKGNVSLSPFDPTDIIAVEASQLGKLLL